MEKEMISFDLTVHVLPLKKAFYDACHGVRVCVCVCACSRIQPLENMTGMDSLEALMSKWIQPRGALSHKPRCGYETLLSQVWT